DGRAHKRAAALVMARASAFSPNDPSLGLVLQIEQAAIELIARATRQPRRFGCRAGGGQLAAEPSQQGIDIHLGCLHWRADADHDLALRWSGLAKMHCELVKRSAPQFLEMLGEFPCDNPRPRAAKRSSHGGETAGEAAR